MGMIVPVGKSMNGVNEIAYRFGAGLGLFLLAGLSGAIFGTVHFFLNKNKKVENTIDDDLIDEGRLSLKKPQYSWYFLFCAYALGFGVLFFIAALSGRS